MTAFVIATISPVVLITLACLAGGFWGWLALGYITVLVFFLDRFAAGAGNPDPEAEFPAADSLLIVLGLSHFTLLVLSLWAIGGASGFSGWARGSTAVAAALFFGQISHPTAHELIHRPARPLRLLGRLIYASLMMGHHASAHMLVHHVHVGTDADPNSARRGTGFYRFAARAWPASFRAGLAAETRRRAGRPPWQHPYALYLAVPPVLAAAALILAGLPGLATLIFLCVYAQLQILMADYVQHYGLRRATLPDGRPEPVGPRHSWNAPHVASSAMTLNAPRHSDHHVTPMRPYPNLQLDRTTMPTLPHSLPVMAVLALAPPLWRRIMDPLCDPWSDGPC